jgi:hypothetical protein
VLVGVPGQEATIGREQRGGQRLADSAAPPDRVAIAVFAVLCLASVEDPLPSSLIPKFDTVILKSRGPPRPRRGEE